MSEESIREIVGEIVIDAELKAVGQAVLQELKRLQFRIAELEAELEAKSKLLTERDTKFTNLHTIITKQTERIKRQAARITELEALYAGTKRSKKAATIKAKYKALKAREHTAGIWYGWLR